MYATTPGTERQVSFPNLHEPTGTLPRRHLRVADRSDNHDTSYGTIRHEWIRHLSNNALRVISVLTTYLRPRESFCWPDTARLMHGTGLSRASVFRGLAELQQAGLIRKEVVAGTAGWTLLGIRSSLSPETVLSQPCDTPTLTTITKNIYGEPDEGNDPNMGTVSNIRRSSGGDDGELRPEKKPTPPASPQRQAVLLLGQFFTTLTKVRINPNERSADYRVLSALWSQYGEDSRGLIEKAWEARDKLLNDRFPKFTLQTVAFFEKYRYVHVPTMSPEARIAQISEMAREPEGINADRFAQFVRMYRVRDEDLQKYLSPKGYALVSDSLERYRLSQVEWTTKHPS